jgi:hypothetical protein
VFSEVIPQQNKVIDDDEKSTELSMSQLHAKHQSLVHEYAAAGNRLRKLQRVRARRSAELISFWEKVEALERPILERDALAAKKKAGNG